MSTITTPRELKAVFPYMFAQPMDQWAFSFARGWFPLIVAACQDIDELVRDESYKHRFHWVQIKEKWGSLRLYWHARGLRDETYVDLMGFDSTVATAATAPTGNSRDAKIALQIRAIASRAMQASTSSCMACGAPGHLRRLGWVVTLCDEHARQLEGEQIDPYFTEEEGG